MSAPLLMLDYDGVVVDSLEIFSSSFLEGCRRAGLTGIATQEDVLRLFEGNVYESLRAAGAGDEQVRRVVRRAADALKLALPALRPFPLMPEVLTELGEARRQGAAQELGVAVHCRVLNVQLRAGGEHARRVRQP